MYIFTQKYLRGKKNICKLKKKSKKKKKNSELCVKQILLLFATLVYNTEQVSLTEILIIEQYCLIKG